MSDEMKLIMENWNGYLLNESVTAEEYIKKIKIGLAVLAAKAAGTAALKALSGELGPQALELGLEMVKTIPAVGSVVSGLSTLFKSGKLAVSGIMASKEMAQAAGAVLKIGAKSFVEMSDDKVGKNPLATLFNIDDKMQIPIKDEVLTNFAGFILQYLQDDPQRSIPDPDRFAEIMLAQYMKHKGYFGEVTPPQEQDYNGTFNIYIMRLRTYTTPCLWQDIFETKTQKRKAWRTSKLPDVRGISRRLVFNASFSVHRTIQF